MDGGTGPLDEERLYGLMEVAERQQAAVQAALEGLAAERAALAREREALAQSVRSVQAGAQGAVRSAVTDSLASAATEGAAAVQAATGPLLTRLGAMTEQAGQADAALREVVRWASWRVLAWMVVVVFALSLVGWLSASAVVWWDGSAIRSARLEKQLIQEEVAQMQANRDEWVKTGLQAKLTRCNPGNRPCVQVDERAGAFGPRSDYRVLLGY